MINPIRKCFQIPDKALEHSASFWHIHGNKRLVMKWPMGSSAQSHSSYTKELKSLSCPQGHTIWESPAWARTQVKTHFHVSTHSHQTPMPTVRQWGGSCLQPTTVCWLEESTRVMKGQLGKPGEMHFWLIGRLACKIQLSSFTSIKTTSTNSYNRVFDREDPLCNSCKCSSTTYLSERKVTLSM